MNRVNQRNFTDLDHYDRVMRGEDLPFAEISPEDLAWEYANEPGVDAFEMKFDA